MEDYIWKPNTRLGAKATGMFFVPVFRLGQRMGWSRDGDRNNQEDLANKNFPNVKTYVTIYNIYISPDI